MTIQSFDCNDESLTPDTPALPRPADRARLTTFPVVGIPPVPKVVEFDCDSVDVPEGTPAGSRPPGKERQPVSDP